MYSTTQLLHKIIDDSFLNENGIIRPEYKFNITIPKFKIYNSKFLAKPEDKFETTLFLPEGDGRKGEGGLRTKGYFKFSYKLVQRSRFDVKDRGDFDDVERRTFSVEQSEWYICDLDGNPIEPAPDHTQQRIATFLAQQSNAVSPLTPHPSPVTELPLITVITVVLNGEKYLEQTIQSVINQTYPNVEYIIIDGGSTDGTLDIVKKYEDYIDYWVSEKDKGQSNAINKGWQMSRGEILAWLNSDDTYKTGTLVYIADFFYKHPEVDMVYGDVDIVDKEDNVISACPRRIEFRLNKLIHDHWYIPQQGVFIRQRVLQKVGMLDENLHFQMDHDFYIRVRLKGCIIKYVPRYLANFRTHPDAKSTPQNWKKVWKEYFLVRRRYGATIFSKIYRLHAWRVLKQKIIVIPLLYFPMGKDIIEQIRKKNRWRVKERQG